MSKPPTTTPTTDSTKAPTFSLKRETVRTLIVKTSLRTGRHGSSTHPTQGP